MHSSFGTVNALAIGTPLAGVTVVPVPDGAVYFRQYTITVTGLTGNQTANLAGYVYDNFANPNALIFRYCPYNGGCNSVNGYSTLPTRRQDAVPLATGVGNGTYTIGFAIYVPDNNGASAFHGSDTGAVRIMATYSTFPWIAATLTINFDTPVETVQQALRLTLSSAPGGLTVTPGGTPEYRINFGNVNGLGIGPAPNVTTAPASGGYIYSTPYVLTPTFSNFTSLGATLSTYVSTDFQHNQVLQLNHSLSGSGFTPISKTSGSQTLITNGASSRASVTAYLGLLVSDRNDSNAFTGTDSATLTFTMTVQ